MIKSKKLLLCLCLLIILSACTTTEAYYLGSVTDFDYTRRTNQSLELLNEEPTVVFQSIFGLSPEGGYLRAIMVNDSLQHLYVRIFGTLGQAVYAYSFTNSDMVIISVEYKNYTQPFYMMPPGILEMRSFDAESYILVGDTLYVIGFESDELTEAEAELKSKIVNQMDNFIALIES